MTKGDQMARVRSKNTEPELWLRAALTRSGVRYRLHRKDLPGTPDVYIARLRLAVFVHGCFWHGHDCPRGRSPKSNATFWHEKIERNRRRDARALSALADLGIGTMTVWSCEMNGQIVSAVAARYHEAKS